MNALGAHWRGFLAAFALGALVMWAVMPPCPPPTQPKASYDR